MSRLLLVRHGKTKLNSTERFWGKTDVELSDEGIRQAKCLRDRLESQKINAVYTSRLSRARVTAEIITLRDNLDITTLAELDEINFGFVEGLTIEEIKRLHPELSEVMKKWNSHPKFPGGESLDDLDTRVQEFLEILKNHKPAETILVVAHSVALRLIICHLLDIDIEHWRQIQTDLASLSIMDTYPQGAVLRLLNGVSHLKP